MFKYGYHIGCNHARERDMRRHGLFISVVLMAAALAGCATSPPTSGWTPPPPELVTVRTPFGSQNMWAVGCWQSSIVESAGGYWRTEYFQNKPVLPPRPVCQHDGSAYGSTGPIYILQGGVWRPGLSWWGLWYSGGMTIWFDGDDYHRAWHPRRNHTPWQGRERHRDH